MIYFLIGDNSFEIERAIGRIVADFDGTPEKIDGSQLDLARLPDLVMGGTLFAARRLVIIKNLAENKTIWANFSDWLNRVDEGVDLVLVEASPDKRTKTYKALQKTATVKEFKSWGEHDNYQAEQWVVEEAKALDFDLDKKSAQALVQRVGLDQWQLHRALEKLLVLDKVTPQVIEEVVEANPKENVFNLLEAALGGNGQRVKSMLETLRQTEDPYMVFGLLSSQVFNLATLALADKPPQEVAKDISAHPYALSKLAPQANKLGRIGVRRVVEVLAEADEDMKSSAAEPWLLIERALLKVANSQNYQ